MFLLNTFTHHRIHLKTTNLTNENEMENETEAKNFSYVNKTNENLKTEISVI